MYNNSTLHQLDVGQLKNLSFSIATVHYQLKHIRISKNTKKKEFFVFIFNILFNKKLTAVLVGKTQSNKSQPKAEQTTKSTAKLYKIKLKSSRKFLLCFSKFKLKIFLFKFLKLDVTKTCKIS